MSTHPHPNSRPGHDCSDLTNDLASFHRRHQPRSDLTTITVAGEIDVSNVHQLRHLLSEALGAGVHRVDVQVAGLRFCDARTLGALAHCASDLKARGGQLAVVGASPFLLRILQLTDLVGPFDVERDALELPVPRVV